MPYQMPNGKWRAKRMIQGKVKTHVFATKQEAKKWEAGQSLEQWQEENQPTPTVCLLDFCTAYMDMATERFSAKTISEKKLAFKHMLKVLRPDMPVDGIAAQDGFAVLRQVAILSSGYAANKTRKNLAASWEWGKKYYGLPSVNPFREVEKFPADQTPRYVPPEADFWRVYEIANSIDKVFLLFLLHTGARRSEVFRLKWEDIDLFRKQVRLGTKKTAHGGMEYAWIPLTNSLRDALEALKDTCASRTVFVSQRTGEPYTARQHMMQRLCAAAGVKKFGLHAIRHLTATILAHEGLDLPTVQAILRHNSPNTTARYIKSFGINPEKMERVFEKRRGAKVVPFTPLKNAIGT